MTNIEFNEERFDIPHGVDDKILNTLLDRIAKYTVQQNTPPDNKPEYDDGPTEGIEEKISIDEAIYDYMQGRHDRKNKTHGTGK